jgi:hypothetical protein
MGEGKYRTWEKEATSCWHYLPTEEGPEGNFGKEKRKKD